MRTNRAVARRPALAKPGDPLVLDDGRIIAPERAHIQVTPPKISPQTFKAQKRRTVKELPAPESTMRGIATVFVYSMMGLTAREIADAVGITVDEVEAVKAHSAYTEVFDAVLDEFVNSNSEMIQSRIAAYSHSALDTVADVMLNGKREENKLRAADSLLNRASDQAKAGKSQQNELRIVIVDNEKNVDVQVHVGV